MKRKQGRIESMTVLVSIGMIFGFVFWPVFTGPGGPKPITRCLSNVKQVSLGLLIYASDYDDRLPRTEWIPATKPYLKDEKVFRCPQVKPSESYALNANLLGHKLGENDAEAAKIAMVLEVDRNVSPDSTTLSLLPLSRPRHRDLQVVGFLDGHARAIQPTKTAEIRLVLEKPKPGPGQGSRQDEATTRPR